MITQARPISVLFQLSIALTAGIILLDSQSHTACVAPDHPSRPVSWKLLKLFHRNCVWFTIVQAPSMLSKHYLHYLRIAVSSH